MNLTNKLMKIVELVNDNGGVNFIKIRMFLEDIEREIVKGNKNAIQFNTELDHVLKVVEHATKLELG